MSDDAYEALADSLIHNRELQLLELSSCQSMSRTSQSMMAEALESNSTLTTFIYPAIAESETDKGCIQRIVTALMINAQSLEENKPTKIKEFNFHQYLSKLESGETTFRFNHLPLSDDNLAELLMTKPEIRILNLRDTNLGFAGAKILCKFITKTQALHKLDISNNPITPEVFKFILMAVITNTTLTEFNIELDLLDDNSIDVLADTLEAHHRLTDITLPKQRFNRLILDKIERLLTLNRLFQELGLFPLKRKKFAVLPLQNRNISDSLLESLIQKLAFNWPWLTELDLSLNPISPIGMTPLIDFLKTHDKLTKLNLTDIKMDAQSVKNLVAAMKSNQNLRKLKLSENSDIPRELYQSLYELVARNKRRYNYSSHEFSYPSRRHEIKLANAPMMEYLEKCNISIATHLTDMYGFGQFDTLEDISSGFHQFIKDFSRFPANSFLFKGRQLPTENIAELADIDHDLSCLKNEKREKEEINSWLERKIEVNSAFAFLNKQLSKIGTKKLFMYFHQNIFSNGILLIQKYVDYYLLPEKPRFLGHQWSTPVVNFTFDTSFHVDAIFTGFKVNYDDGVILPINRNVFSDLKATVIIHSDEIPSQNALVEKMYTNTLEIAAEFFRFYCQQRRNSLIPLNEFKEDKSSQLMRLYSPMPSHEERLLLLEIYQYWKDYPYQLEPKNLYRLLASIEKLSDPRLLDQFLLSRYIQQKFIDLRKHLSSILQELTVLPHKFHNKFDIFIEEIEKIKKLSHKPITISDYIDLNKKLNQSLNRILSRRIEGTAFSRFNSAVTECHIPLPIWFALDQKENRRIKPASIVKGFEEFLDTVRDQSIKKILFFDGKFLSESMLYQLNKLRDQLKSILDSKGQEAVLLNEINKNCSFLSSLNLFVFPVVPLLTYFCKEFFNQPLIYLRKILRDLSQINACHSMNISKNANNQLKFTTLIDEIKISDHADDTLDYKKLSPDIDLKITLTFIKNSSTDYFRETLRTNSMEFTTTQFKLFCQRKIENLELIYPGIPYSIPEELKNLTKNDISLLINVYHYLLELKLPSEQFIHWLEELNCMSYELRKVHKAMTLAALRLKLSILLRNITTIRIESIITALQQLKCITTNIGFIPLSEKRFRHLLSLYKQISDYNQNLEIKKKQTMEFCSEKGITRQIAQEIYSWGESHEAKHSEEAKKCYRFSASNRHKNASFRLAIFYSHISAREWYAKYWNDRAAREGHILAQRYRDTLHKERDTILVEYKKEKKQSTTVRSSDLLAWMLRRDRDSLKKELKLSP